jgi:hypothetical protein
MDVMDKDREDWMLAGVEVDSLDKDYGPYDVAACCDEWGRNSHLCVYWTEAMDCLCQDWAGRNVLSNPPFSRALEILAHALQCKVREPVGTSATFILPVWVTARFWKEIIRCMPKTFQVVRTWKAGSHLFTTPASSVERAAGMGERLDCGPTRWDVVALRIRPGPLTEPLAPVVKRMSPILTIHEVWATKYKKRRILGGPQAEDFRRPPDTGPSRKRPRRTGE